jgi:hypothetical protein
MEVVGGPVIRRRRVIICAAAKTRGIIKLDSPMEIGNIRSNLMRGGWIGMGVKVIIRHGARGQYWCSLLKETSISRSCSCIKEPYTVT